MTDRAMTDRVLIVDDSAVIRRLLTEALSGDERIEVVGTAADGQIALQQIAELKPDLVTLDIEMPVMDGLATLEAIRATDKALPVIMFSTLTERGASITLQALEKGADDYVAKPSNSGSMTESLEAIRRELVPTIKALCSRRKVASFNGGHFTRPTLPTHATPPVAQPRIPDAGGRVTALAIGCSTGGPEALGSFLAAIPATVGVPIFVTQHMPPVFTKQFAERLDQRLPLSVKEAEEGDRPQAGTVYIAPGDFHLLLKRNPAGEYLIRLDQGLKENFCRPAVDPMFRSITDAYGNGVLGVILTGMGHDGALGSGHIKRAGGTVLVQDEASSVVWGMPGATVEAGNADQVLPLDALAQAVVQRLARLAPVS